MRYVLIIFMFYGLIGCYEPIDGCLDNDAVNYDVTADNLCDACCNLPSLTVSMSYPLGDGVFNLGDTLLSRSGEKIVVQDFHFFIDDFTLINEAGEPLFLEDSVRYFVDEEIRFIPDDFRFFEKSRFSGEFEGIRYAGGIDQFIFEIGMPEESKIIPLDSIEANSGLSNIPDDAINTEGGFIYAKLVVQNEDSTSVVTYNIVDEAISNVVVPIDDFFLERGKNASITLEFRVEDVLLNYSFNNSQDVNETSIRDGFRNAFQQKQ